MWWLIWLLWNQASFTLSEINTSTQYNKNQTQTVRIRASHNKNNQFQRYRCHKTLNTVKNIYFLCVLSSSQREMTSHSNQDLLHLLCKHILPLFRVCKFAAFCSETRHRKFSRCWQHLNANAKCHKCQIML